MVKGRISKVAVAPIESAKPISMCHCNNNSYTIAFLLLRKKRKGYGITVICNKISNIEANRRTLVGFFTSLSSNAIPDLLRRPKDVFGNFCPVHACQICKKMGIMLTVQETSK